MDLNAPELVRPWECCDDDDEDPDVYPVMISECFAM